MNRYIISFILFIIFGLSGRSQEIGEGNLQINGGIDLLTSPSGTPLKNINNRIRGDLDFNYFFQDRFFIGCWI